MKILIKCRSLIVKTIMCKHIKKDWLSKKLIGEYYFNEYNWYWPYS